jgi:hypothetical protein
LELGTAVVDGVCDPTAQVRIPLATVNRHGLVAAPPEPARRNRCK